MKVRVVTKDEISSLPNFSYTIIEIIPSEWEAATKSCQKTVPGLKIDSELDQIYFAFPITGETAFNNAGITQHCVEENKLKLTCTTLPSESISLQVVIFNNGTLIAEGTQIPTVGTGTAGSMIIK